MTHKKFDKLLLIGSTINPVHVKNYFYLIKDHFNEIEIVGSHEIDFCKHHLINFQVSNPIKLIGNILRLRKIIKTYNPTFIHVHQANSIGFITSLANKKRFPQVLTTWGDDVLIFPKKNFFFRLLTKTSIKYSDALTADAEIMGTAIAEFTGRKDTVIANFGIDFDFSKLLPKENIIYSNRLHDPLYNIDKIIEGTIPFLEKNPSWILVVAATGILTNKLIEIANKSNVKEQIKFVGFLNRNENTNYYLRSRIYISIPNTDGTSISLLESMAYGTIPVVSNLPANKEWIVSKDNGIVVDSVSIFEALNSAIELDEEIVREKNKEIINQKATKSVNREKFLSIYSKLLND
jgi:glycosyltransferase involved in cell wall biosynthesis